MANEAIIKSVKQIVDEKMKNFNRETGLIREINTPNYHSRLKPGELHFINISTKLAAAIFSCGYEKYYDDAKAMLKNVIALQRTTGELSGLWSVYLEESLEEMVMPDWNYADFNAYPMLYILKEHSDKLDVSLRKDIEDACSLACYAIVRRNLAVDYTNPTVMGIYCTILCGILLGDSKLLDYGKHKLEKLYFHIMKAGTYEEYNSPTYSLLAADIYSLILRHIDDADVIEKVTVLNHILWNMLGEHYHFELGEICGPHLRQYTEFLTSVQCSTIQNAVSAELGITESNQASLLSAVYDTKCPDEELPLFLEKNKNKDFRRIVTPGAIYPKFYWPQVDTQCIRPNFALGSNSMSDCWNQRCNVVSYIGNKEEKVYIRLRAYLDGYDFSSGFSVTAQKGGTALSVTNFHTDWGKTHPTLDPVIDGKFMAKDLRVLYQIKANTDGIIEKIKTEKTQNGYRLNVLGTQVEILFPFAEITGGTPYIETEIKDNEMLISLVLYSGEEKEIDFSVLDSMAVVSVLSVGENAPAVTVEKKSGFILAESTNLKIKSPHKPLKQMHSSLLNEILIDGENVLKLADM